MKVRDKKTRTKKVETLANTIKGVGAKRFNMNLTAKEHKALKMLALENDMTITDLVKKSVNEYMSKSVFE